MRRVWRQVTFKTDTKGSGRSALRSNVGVQQANTPWQQQATPDTGQTPVQVRAAMVLGPLAMWRGLVFPGACSLHGILFVAPLAPFFTSHHPLGVSYYLQDCPHPSWARRRMTTAAFWLTTVTRWWPRHALCELDSWSWSLLEELFAE